MVTNSSSRLPSTKASLLADLRKGAEAAAWTLFVDLYTPVVYHYCRRRGLQDADSRDVTQHVMARVFWGISNFEYNPAIGRFRCWLGAIAAREIIRYRGRSTRPGRGAGGGEGDEIAARMIAPADSDWLEEFNAQVLRIALIRIRGRFDEATWQAFDLTWLGDVEADDATRRLGRTAAWIYKARFRVLKRLREEVTYLSEDAAALQRPT